MESRVDAARIKVVGSVTGAAAAPRDPAASRLGSHARRAAARSRPRARRRRPRRSRSLLIGSATPVTSRFVVGIDLGTTNCALALGRHGRGRGSRSDPPAGHPAARAPGEVGAAAAAAVVPLPARRDRLPGRAASALPWDRHPRYVVGEFARSRGAENPARLVATAKSWLSHAGVDRTAPILPWGAPADDRRTSRRSTPRPRTSRTSPRRGTRTVAAGKRTLALAQQDVVLTVPASFDAAARELTVEAAARGRARARHAARGAAGRVLRLARRRAATAGGGGSSVGDLVLVCDVGGGTTDFTLIAVARARRRPRARARRGRRPHPARRRQHGPRARARCCSSGSRPTGTSSTPGSCTGCGISAGAPRKRCSPTRRSASAPVTLLGRGSRLIGGTIKTTLTATT